MSKTCRRCGKWLPDNMTICFECEPKEETEQLIATLETERDNWIETARQYALNSDYYRGLVVKVGEMLGPEVYVSDDGSVHLDVLCAKVPELAAQRIGELEAFVSQYTYPGMTAGVKGSIDRERTILARRLLGRDEETGE